MALRLSQADAARLRAEQQHNLLVSRLVARNEREFEQLTTVADLPINLVDPGVWEDEVILEPDNSNLLIDLSEDAALLGLDGE